MRKTVKRNRYNKRSYTHRKRGKRSKGGGIGPSKLTYPPLPPSPPSTPRNKRPSVLTNNESLIGLKSGSNEYEKRKARLLKHREGIQPTLLNRLLGIEQPKPKLNRYGYPKSAFTINNNKVGFK